MGDHTRLVPFKINIDGKEIELTGKEVIVECIPNPPDVILFGEPFPFCILKVFQVTNFGPSYMKLWQTAEGVSDSINTELLGYEGRQLTERIKRETMETIKKAMGTGQKTYKVVAFPFPNFSRGWEEEARSLAIWISEGCEARFFACDVKQMVEGVDNALYNDQPPHSHLEKCLKGLNDKKYLEYAKKNFSPRMVEEMRRLKILLAILSKLDLPANT